jgi:hypothetical protein
MSRGTAKKAKELEAQPQLIFDAKRDINPFWRSSLFSDVYLKMMFQENTNIFGRMMRLVVFMIFTKAL